MNIINLLPNPLFNLRYYGAGAGAGAGSGGGASSIFPEEEEEGFMGAAKGWLRWLIRQTPTVLVPKRTQFKPIS
jgi:hypothetical protein